MHTEFWWGNPKDRDHLEDLGVDGKTLKKTITRNCTQYCLTWLFLPSAHVVKFLICLVCIVDSFNLSCV